MDDEDHDVMDRGHGMVVVRVEVLILEEDSDGGDGKGKLDDTALGAVHEVGIHWHPAQYLRGLVLLHTPRAYASSHVGGSRENMSLSSRLSLQYGFVCVWSMQNYQQKRGYKIYICTVSLQCEFSCVLLIQSF